MLFDQNRVDAIIHNWKNQVFSNETIPGVPQRHSTCLKPPYRRVPEPRVQSDLKETNNFFLGLIVWISFSNINHKNSTTYVIINFVRDGNSTLKDFIRVHRANSQRNLK